MKNKLNQLLLLGALIASTLIIGCAGQQVTTDAGTGISHTNFVANPVVTQIASGTALAAPIVPQPWGALIGAVGVLAATVAAGIARYQNAKLNEHKTMLGAVITGVEMGNNPTTKAAIQTVISASGLQPKLDALVQQATGSMPKP